MQKRTSNKGRQADAIEITPEMILRGVKVFESLVPDDRRVWQSEDIVRMVVQAVVDSHTTSRPRNRSQNSKKRDEVLKRMLQTPHKPHKKSKKAKKSAKAKTD